jgi:hypothetical protein
MDWLTDLSWREFPAALLIVAGVSFFSWGTWREIDGFGRPVTDPNKVLTIVTGFRLSIVGLVLAGLGAAWWWQITWLALLSIAIGVVEILESSTMIYGLRMYKRIGDQQADTHGR